MNRRKRTAPVLVFRRREPPPAPRFTPEQIEVYELVQQALDLPPDSQRLFLNIAQRAIAESLRKQEGSK